jgi:hypothetical protein
MSEKELEDKFKSMASNFMTGKSMQKVIQTIYQLDELKNIGDLMKQLIFTRPV